MLSLVKIDFIEFKKDVYKQYLDLFPKDERKPLRYLKKLFKKRILKFVKIMDEEKNIGFLIYIIIENIPLVLLDYFAIYREYQNKKYGSKSIEAFKTFFSEYDGIYIEIEKNGLGKNAQENEIRKRRIKFWKNLEFSLIDINLKLFGIIYSPCIFKIKDFSYSEEKIIEYAFMIYSTIFGEKRTKKHCCILKK